MAREPHERSWWQILWLLARGHTATAVAGSTGYNRAWIGQIAKRYNTAGLAGMINWQHTTSWRARDVADRMAAKLGRPVATQRGWDYLQRLKHSPQVPRPQHALANLEQQDTYKKS